MSPARLTSLLALATLCACLGGPGAAWAGTCSSQASGSWHVAGTWSCSNDGDGIPDGDDSVSIGAHEVSVAAAASASSLTLSGGLITFSAAAPLTVSGGMSATSGTLRGNGTATVAGSFSKTGDGTLSITNNGALGSPDLTLNGPATHGGGFIDPCRNGDQDPDQPNVHINNTFTLAAGAHATPFNCSGGRLHVNAPNGHFIKAPGSAATSTIHPKIDNDDTLTVQEGELILQGGISGESSDGAYVANSGTTLQFDGPYQIGASGRVGGAGTIDMSALPMTLAAGATFDPAVLNLQFGLLTLDGTSAVSIPTVNQTGATIDTDRPLTFTNFTTTGGAISGNASVTVPVGGSFSKTGPGTLSITNSGGNGAAELILNVNASFDGGRIDACRTGDQDPDQPKLHINRDFTIGAVEAPAFNCSGSGDNIRVNGPSGHLKKSGSGTTTSHTGILVDGGTVSLANGQGLTVNNLYTQTGGLTDIAAGGTLGVSPATLSGGVLRGSGQVSGNLTNSGGTVRPGTSPGTLTVTGNYAQGSGGTLETEIAGASSFDRLVVGGTATLNGTLAILNSHNPGTSETFEILTSTGTRSGAFSDVTGEDAGGGKRYEANYNPNNVTLSVVVDPAQNISPPSIAGTPVEGETLTCNPGTWTGSPSFSFEWLRDGTPIAGATSQTYTLTADDVGKEIRCRVSGTNSAGSDTATSAPANPTAKPRPLDPQPEPQPQQPQGPTCDDRVKPTSRLKKSGVRQAGGKLTLSGRSRDTGGPCPSGLRRVQVSIAKVAGRTGVNCRFLRLQSRFSLTRPQNCRRPVLFTADGTERWSVSFALRLAPGQYRAQVRGVDQAGNKETPKKGRSIVFFTVR